MHIIDISPLISEDMAVFPGDTPFQRKVALSFENGDHLALSSFESTVHLGAHTDAPNHYHPEGQDIGGRALERYLGPCQVITTTGLPPMGRITPDHLAQVEICAPRILFRTLSFQDPNQWHNDFNALSPELIDWLADQGVTLVGIDTPSVDPAPAKVLTSHLAIYERDMAILEGIVLEHVKDGLYQLIALPLKIKGADASPVRAILLDTPLIPSSASTITDRQR